MAGKRHKKELRKIQTAMRQARKQGRGALFAQTFEERVRELGYQYDPYRKGWVHSKF